MVKRILFWGSLAFLLAMAVFWKFALVGYSFLALVSVFLAGLLGCYGLLHLLVQRYGKPFHIVRRVLNICVCVGLALVTVTEGIIIHASLGQPEESCQYMVVLGCMVREDGPSEPLRNRIDAAYDYLIEHPDVIAIVSGGQGEDEPMAEAQCMYDHLVGMGINPDRIWMEDKATSTWENLQFSLALIEEKTGSRPATVGLLSSEYHLFRASLQARDLDIKTVCIPARTTRPSQALNHFLREVAGVWHYLLLGNTYD